ncbi:MAG: hypothetical protein IPK26_26545 [Planctomycetes bacterium]|nr:hypothetical protein [Planctomycetota bacterium]
MTFPRIPDRFPTALAAAFLSFLGMQTALAQCDPPAWARGFNTLGPDGGEVRATALWDPDGPGPLSARLVVAGVFETVGGIRVNNVAAWDPATGTWHAFADGVDGEVNCVIVRPNGELVVAGTFVTASGVTVNSIARWTGSGWLDLAGGLTYWLIPATVRALTTTPTGELLVGGTFLSAGGVGTSHLARWNGSNWFSMGGPGPITALAVRPNGRIVASGPFTQMVLFFTYYYSTAEWTGSSWVPLDTPTPSSQGSVRAVALLASGDVIAGGTFTGMDGVAAANIARWNGTNWSAIGAGTSGPVEALLPQSGGAFLVGGRFTTAGGIAVNNVARYTGTSWTAAGAGVTQSSGPTARVCTFTVLSAGNVAMGGTFDRAGGATAANLAHWDGVTVTPLGLATDAQVRALAALPNGQLLVGGDFTRIWSLPANRIARWTGTEWTALGSGMNGTVDAVARLTNGDLVAGGTFTMAGGVAANRIARWNGSSWSALGTGMPARVRALAVTSNGDLWVGGDFAGGVQRWNSSSGWSIPGGSGALTGTVWSLVQTPNLDVIAGGQLTFVGTVPAGNIARWNGIAWSTMGTGMNNPVTSLAALPGGEVIAGGLFTTAGGIAANRIARWSGRNWSAMGAGFNGSVRALGRLPTGDLIAGGEFSVSGAVVLDRIARWNRNVWEAVAGGMPGLTSNVSALATTSDFELIAGGTFQTAGGVHSPNIARLQSHCRPQVAAYGTACGPHHLTATNLPWLGTTFQAQTTCTAPCLAAVVNGFTTMSMPLANLLPQALPGCLLLVSNDIVETPLILFGSMVLTAVPLPASPSLAGLTFHQQVVEARLDAAGAISAFRSTNALTMTLGGF